MALQFKASLALTSPLNLPAPGRRQTVYVVFVTSHSPVFLVNSRYPLFSATSSGSACSAPPQRHTLSRSYGVNLPSSLTTVLSNALEYSSRPPESVCGTDSRNARPAAFLGSIESLSLTFRRGGPSLIASRCCDSLFVRYGPGESTYKLEPAPSPG